MEKSSKYNCSVYQCDLDIKGEINQDRILIQKYLGFYILSAIVVISYNTQKFPASAHV